MKSHIMELFPDLFNGIGTIKDAEVKLDVNPDVTPIVQALRKYHKWWFNPWKRNWLKWNS